MSTSNKHSKSLKATVFFATLYFLVASNVSAQLLDRIVAVVNDDIITLSELEEAGKEFLQKIASTAPDDELSQATQSAKERILNQIINQRLISQQAELADISLPDTEFEQTYAKNIEAMNVTESEWLQKLEEAGLSEETYRKNLKNQLLRDKLVLYEVRSKIIITDEMINDYYTTEYATENQGGGYYLLQMGFTWGTTAEIKSTPGVLEADQARALQRAEKIRQKVVDGEDFGQLARQHSELPSAADGGDLGVFQEDEMAEYMRGPVLALKVSEVTPVIETPIGYQFFKLLSIEKGETVHQAPLFEVKEEIRKKLFERKFRQEYQAWVENIKEGAYIKKML